MGQETGGTDWTCRIGMIGRMGGTSGIGRTKRIVGQETGGISGTSQTF